MQNIQFDRIGTKWSISIDSQISIESDIINLVEEFDQNYSRFRVDSLLYSLKNKVGVFQVGKEFVEILRIYFDFYNKTQGRFTPLSGIVLEDLGYDKDYSFIQKEKIRNIPGLEDSIQILSDEKIKVLKPISLDFGGIGKGFLIDKIYNFLREKSIDEILINGGGDIRFFSKKREYIDIGLENPINADEVIGIYKLKSSMSICGSSTLRRAWNGKNHIVDTVQKDGTKENISSWIVSDNAKLSDLLATIFLIPGFEEFELPNNFEYLLIDSNMHAYYSDSFKDRLFDL